MCGDMPAGDDDDVCGGTNFVVHKQAFNCKEEAEKYLKEVMIPEDKANLEECYGLNNEDFEPLVEIIIEDGTFGRKELIAYDKDTRNEINTTIYEIAEVEVG